MEELQGLLERMEAESSALKDKMAADQAALLQLKADGGEAGADERRLKRRKEGKTQICNHFC